MKSKITYALLVILIAMAASCIHSKHTHTAYQYPELFFFPKMSESGGDNPSIEAIDLGRHLFYDPILSKDSTISCATCHRQSVAFSDAPNQFSKGIDGQATSRNTMPLFNLAWYPSFFWDGKAANLVEQVFHPVSAHDEMNLAWNEAVKRITSSKFYQQKFYVAYGKATIDSTLIADAIAQFERTLISNNSKYDRVLKGQAYLTAEELAGFDLMNDQTKGDCLHCHTTDSDALGTTARFSNNGLDNVSSADQYTDKGKGSVTGNPNDMGLFRIPSLRNIALTGPYMHDGRFETLEAVLDFYSEGVSPSLNVDPVMASAHRGGVHLSETEKTQIIAFLHTLTDSVFITNPAYGTPF